MDKKGFKMSKKGLKKGFLKNWVGNSSSSSSSTPSFEAKKANLISELNRILPIRNEFRKIREASNQPDNPDFIDDREKEAYETFQYLFGNAGWDLLRDPDVVKTMDKADVELEIELSAIQLEKSSMRVKKAKDDFISGLNVGREVRVVEGENIGMKGKVLEVRGEDDSVKLRFLNGEEVVLFVGDVAYLRSEAEDICLMGLMARKSKGKGKEKEDVCMMELMGMRNKYDARNKYY